MKIADVLATTPVSQLDLSRYVAVRPSDPVAAVVAEMGTAGQPCACIVDGDSLAGVFTQRDALLRALGRPSTWDRPVADEMTAVVRTIGPTAAVSDGLAIMNDWWVRNVPVVGGDGSLVGNLSYRTVMRAMAEVLASRLDEPASGLAAEHGMAFVDFSGLHTSTPVTVGLAETVDVAAHHMAARAIGSVLVVDDRDHLVGMLTEYDLLMKVGCREPDLSKLAVKEVMTPEPVALAVRSPIVDALRRMAAHDFSHVPLLGESGRPVAVASFRDVATYFESALATLG